MGDTRGPHVHRPAASAVWEFEHNWGPGFGDSTTFSVARIDGGGMTLRYGKEKFEVRRDLVAQVAEMVAAAAAWSDEVTA